MSVNNALQAQTLQEFWSELLPDQCTSCRLCTSRTAITKSRGTCSTGVVLLGESPGADEDQEGRPFVGRAGQLFERMLDEAGLDAGECYFTNSCRCWPGPGNPTPSAEMIQACRSLLVKEMELLDPKIIVAVGSSAVTSLSDNRRVIMARVAGRIFKSDILNRNYLAIYHPAYFLHQTDEVKKKETIKTLAFARTIAIAEKEN